MAIRITRSIVPNLFTLANLFSGFNAIILFSKAEFMNGALFILLAGIFDMLDGIMARLTKSASELGVELDSLCDAVSFGVAPSVLLYNLLYHDYGSTGILLASLPAMAGVYRLARFNTQLVSLEDKRYFRGMPIPAGALTLISFAVFYLYAGKIPAEYKYLTSNFVTILTAAAMVSTIRYDNLPRPSVSSIRGQPILFAFVLASVVAVIVTAGDAAFPVMMLYMIAGAVRQVIHWMQQRQHSDEDEEEDDDEDE